MIRSPPRVDVYCNPLSSTYTPDLMFSYRSQIRQYFCEVFSRHENNSELDAMGQIVLDIILLHPEYHAILRDPNTAIAQEYTVEQGQTNPFLHMGMHLAIREQVSVDRPQGVAAAYNQLVQKLDVSEAEHKIIECLGSMLWESHSSNQPPNESGYLACIHKLI